jgi:hypothetical protein
MLVAGVHYLQEDSPDHIGPAIAAWMRALAGKSQSKYGIKAVRAFSPLPVENWHNPTQLPEVNGEIVY